MFNKIFIYMIVSVIVVLSFMSCQSSQPEELYIVDHYINTKAYGGDTSIDLYFVSNKDIPIISEVGINYNYDLNSSLGSHNFTKFTKSREYKENYIYYFSVELSDLNGAIDIYEVTFKSESGIQYRFDTNVYVSSDYERDNHIYGYVGEDDEVPITYYDYKNGIEMELTPKDSILIEDIYFEGESSMNLTDYIHTVNINDEPLNAERFIESDESFTLEIEFSGLDGWHGYIIDILVASYISEGEDLSTAYIMVPLEFGHPTIGAEALIDATWGQSG